MMATTEYEPPCSCPTRTEYVTSSYAYPTADQVVTLRIWIQHQTPCPHANAIPDNAPRIWFRRRQRAAARAARRGLEP